MSYEELSKSVKLSEGFRNKIYQDTEGFDTEDHHSTDRVETLNDDLDVGGCNLSGGS